MDRLVGWWAGAVRRGGADLGQVVRASGRDRAVLAEFGAAELVDAGVRADLVEAWGRFAPLASRGRILRLCDPDYPERLAAIDEPPPALFVEGDAAILGRDAVAVVGTRACTSLGELAARRVSRGLAAAGLVVVSGLARGIDAAAHRGALDAGTTVAVLGHGLAHTSPASNRALRAEIVARGGAVVSTFPDQFPPERWTFPVRNRWIAGLSRAGVIVEAPADSGALLTADAFRQLQRPVFVVPGPGGGPSWGGGHRWIKDGHAELVDGADEVARRLLSGAAAPPQETWLSSLFSGLPLDEVARLRGGSTLDLLRDLQARELRGEVVRLPGQRYAPGGDPS